MESLKEKYINKQRDLSEIGITPKFPRIIKIDICNRCNYSCIFCPQSKQDQGSKVGNIDDDLCMKIINDAYIAGAREICLSSTGEPLLNKQLEKYISTAKSLGYEYIFFNTNGFLMNKKRITEFLTGGVDSVKFSINGAGNVYGLVHGTEGYDKVIENLKLFDDLRKRLNSNCKLYVSYVSTKLSYVDVEQVKRDVSKYVDDIMIMNANNRGGVADEVDQELFYGDDDYTYKFPCSQLFNNIYITSEGYVVACCQDFENNMVIADLHNMSVAEAWNCEAFTEFRKLFLERRYSGLLCDNCLNNTHFEITPLNKEFSGYIHSESRVEDVKERINRLKEKAK